MPSHAQCERWRGGRDTILEMGPLMNDAMHDTEEHEERTHPTEQLALLIAYRGQDRVRAILGVDEVTLDGLLSDSVDWPEEVWDRFQRALDNLRAVGHQVEVDDDVALGNTERTEIDPDDDTEVSPGGSIYMGGESDGVVHSVFEPEVSMGPEDRLEEEDAVVNAGLEEERDPSVPWKVRGLIIEQCFRNGVPDHRQLAGLLLLLGQEMAIIWRFGEVPTEPGVPCDAERLRTAFLERASISSIVRGELESMHSGMRGFRSWLLGKGKVNIKKLHSELLAEARAMGPDYMPVPPYVLLGPDDLATAAPLVQTYLSWYRRNR